jgi:glycosyltransferase involved in cell wall biosynthesis
VNPAVSVIIPSYNHEAYVGAAVESVLAGSFEDLELIVVDDGSTDGSRGVLETYRDDPRVVLHLQENRGAHAALNRGLELARGEIAFILDSDDAFDPERIGVLHDRLRSNPGAAIASSWIRVVDAAGSELGIKQAWRTLPPWAPPGPGPRLSDLGDARLALLETNWISTTSNLAFPMRLIREHGLRFAGLRYAHDWDFILSACAFGAVELVERPLLDYRVHGANTIGEGADEGRGAMRFEIMWVVARHGMRTIRDAAGNEAELAHLRRALWGSAPTFGRPEVFDQLVVLRGSGDAPSSGYDALTDPAHPLNRSASAALQT